MPAGVGYKKGKSAKKMPKAVLAGFKKKAAMKKKKAKK